MLLLVEENDLQTTGLAVSPAGAFLRLFDPSPPSGSFKGLVESVTGQLSFRSRRWNGARVPSLYRSRGQGAGLRYIGPVSPDTSPTLL